MNPAVATLAAVLVSSSALAQPFTPTSIGTLGPAFGVNASGAYDINNSHEVVGWSTSSGNPATRAVTWTLGGGLVAVPVIASPFTPPFSAKAINASGDVVGGASVTGGIRAFKTVAGVTTNLGTLNPLLNSEAKGINAQGDVVGTCVNTSTLVPVAGFIYRNGIMSQAGPLTEANDINNAGFVAGSGGSTTQARLWDSNAGTFTSLGTLGGVNSYGLAVNSFNQVVGFSSTAVGTRDAFVWSAALGMVNLNVDAQLGSTDSSAWDINDNGEIVGFFNVPGGQHAFYSFNGVATDLNSWLAPGSGWVLLNAFGINDEGCIVGSGLLSGEERGYIMCIPAPGALCTLALAGTLTARRRR